MASTAPVDQELAVLEYTVSELEMLIKAVLPVMDEGVQVWDLSGRLVFSNKATENHYGDLPIKEVESYMDLVSHCLSESGLPLSSKDFPVARVMETGKPCTGVMVQISAKRAVWLRINAYPIITKTSELSGVLSTSHDVTSMVEKGLRLEMDAHYDNLTGLPNRILLPDRMKVALAHSKRTGEMLAVCLMDLDGFKPINDSMGHEAGDLLLEEVARRLTSALRNEDTALRLGGDEFVLLIGGLKSERDCELAAKRILTAIAVPFRIQNKTVRVTASMGITLYPGDSSVTDKLLRHADQAMYKAKENGKNCYHLFDPTLASRLRANLGTIKRIEKALLENQFELYYQPMVNCAQGKVVGVEALIRWDHPVLGIRAPGEFLPLIEHDDTIIRLGDWVINTVMQQLDTWKSEGINLRVGINISARQFLHDGFEKLLGQLLHNYNPELLERLEIEIIETAALEDMKTVNTLMRQYQEKGVSFALDDFGTGYSSLAHLKYLTADALKIDHSFIREMLCNPGDLAIIQGVIGLADAFQRNVVAEGVESIEQILMLLELGCEVMQGYGIAHPMPAKKIPEWIENFSTDPRWRVAHSRYPMRSDFELLLIEVTHRYWLETVRGKAITPVEANSHHHTNYANCRLTEWYIKTGLPRYGSLSEFREIDILHREVHGIAEDFIKCDREKQPEMVEKVGKQLAIANEKLVCVLRDFRINVVAVEESKKK